MSAYDRPAIDAKTLRPRTKMVHGGTMRSGYRRDLRGFVPDAGVRLQQRGSRRRPLHRRGRRLSIQPLRQSDRRDVRAAHGAARRRGGRARDRDRHGRRDQCADGPGAGGRSRRRLARAVRLLPLYRDRPAAAFRRRNQPGGRRQPRRVEGRAAAQHQDRLSRKPDQPRARRARHRGHRGHRPFGRRHAGGGQCLRHAADAEAARAGRRLRGLFRHQAYRRAGPLPRRRHPGLEDVHRDPYPQLSAPDRTVAVALQRLGAAERAGDAAAARRPAAGQRGQDRRFPRRRDEDFAGLLSRPPGPPAI